MLIIIILQNNTKLIRVRFSSPSSLIIMFNLRFQLILITRGILVIPRYLDVVALDVTCVIFGDV